MRITSTEQIALAIAAPNNLLPRGPKEAEAAWCARAVEAVLKDERSHADMYHRAYWDIQKVLDEHLGTEEEDGAGAGIVADVYLLAYRYEMALKAIESVGGTVAAESIRKAQMPDPFDEADTATRPNSGGDV